MLDLSLMIFTAVISVVSVLIILSSMRVAAREDEQMERLYQQELMKRYQDGGVKQDE